MFNTSIKIGGAILVAVVSAVISGHSTAVGGEAKPPPAAYEGTPADLSLVSVDRSETPGASIVPATDLLLSRGWRRRRVRYDLVVVRFADDFVVGFEHLRDARRFLADLRGRFAKFGLELLRRPV